ncbi:MAG: 1,4-alpha-glucan branching protein GlgB [Verrucomicrobia bacterium]|nr:1,4-alpha-glucan branching protein GlgB [Verrucomicrobiota bacterium]MCH8510890.1 1,4-alpha-glucan branching protein GlgB [Kiritimatiellia bacterium]
MSAKKSTPVPKKYPEDIQRLVDAVHYNPYGVLGPQSMEGPEGKGGVIRAFFPHAKSVNVVDGDRTVAMEMVHPHGIYEAKMDALPESYAFDVEDREHGKTTCLDPYAHRVSIPDTDLYLFGEGTHYRTYDNMGAHVVEVNGVSGVRFAVWAPNAERVSIIGDFNRWDGRTHPMQSLGASGIWALFIPGMGLGDLYKFEIKGQNGFLSHKSDPYAFSAELRPRTASRVWDIHAYEWQDAEWMDQRRKHPDFLNRPVSVYECHLGSWKRVADEEGRFMTYRELAADLLPYVKEMGFTHIELMPVTEHPFDGSWGYQTLGYYAVTSRFGTPDDFKYFVDCCHREGIGVVLDWVPAHFPKDPHGLGFFDGSHLYEHADPRKGEHMDWGTLIFNYDRNEVRTFLLSSAMFWADVYHLDGIRVDAVASMLYLDYSREGGEWLPNEFGGRENLGAVSFLKQFNEVIHREFPGFLTFAEESTAWPMVSRPTYLGGLGFGLKWNMGWMNDTLEYIEKEPIHRKYHHGEITFSLIYAFNENFILPFSHDEVVHGKKSMLDKMPGDFWQKFANLRLLYSYMWTHPGKKLLFMGCEFGQWKEWDSADQLEWHLTQYEPHLKIRNLVRDLNHLHQNMSALHELDFSGEGFEWIDLHDSEQSILCYLRKGKDPKDVVVVGLNFTPQVRENYRMGVPRPGFYREILNSDSEIYGGSNRGNAGGVHSDPTPWMGRPHSICLTLPPLGAVLLKPE